jgi:hypothetical protein
VNLLSSFAPRKNAFFRGAKGDNPTLYFANDPKHRPRKFRIQCHVLFLP